MTAEILNVPIKIRFTGGDAEAHRVEAHAGSTSLLGITRALQIVTQSYLQNQASSRGTALKYGDIYLTKASAGSLLFDFNLSVFRKKPEVTLNVETYFDFVKTVLSRASGKSYEPTTPYVKKLDNDESDDLLDVTVELVDDALSQSHRAIGRSIEGISIERSRLGTQVYFDQETQEYVQASITSPDYNQIIGHITRFNTVTGNGRAFINEHNRIIPFSLSDGFSQSKRGLITWSLHGSNVRVAKNLTLDAKNVSSSGGIIKRLILSDVIRTGDD